MLLLFHKGINAEGLYGVTNAFTPLDKNVYVSVVMEADDQWEDHQSFLIRCRVGSTLVLEHEVSLRADCNLYSVWFDVARMHNRQLFQRIPLVASVCWAGHHVLFNRAELATASVYTKSGVLGGVSR